MAMQRRCEVCGGKHRNPGGTARPIQTAVEHLNKAFIFPDRRRSFSDRRRSLSDRRRSLSDRRRRSLSDRRRSLSDRRRSLSGRRRSLSDRRRRSLSDRRRRSLSDRRRRSLSDRRRRSLSDRRRRSLSDRTSYVSQSVPGALFLHRHRACCMRQMRPFIQMETILRETERRSSHEYSQIGGALAASRHQIQAAGFASLLLHVRDAPAASSCFAKSDVGFTATQRSESWRYVLITAFIPR
nr:uncharacterized protein LOC112279871 [Physcomitrium patens]|eukprot:XP_024370370.1 uncharacterized protein LOC112279871 [Physcomitrella patens]